MQKRRPKALATADGRLTNIQHGRLNVAEKNPTKQVPCGQVLDERDYFEHVKLCPQCHIVLEVSDAAEASTADLRKAEVLADLKVTEIEERARSYIADLFTWCPLSIRRTRRKSISSTVKIGPGMTAEITLGVIGKGAIMPYGLDLAVLDALSSQAKRTHNRAIEAQTTADMIELLGIPYNDSGQAYREFRMRAKRLGDLLGKLLINNAVQLNVRIFELESLSLPTRKQAKYAPVAKHQQCLFPFRFVFSPEFFQHLERNYTAIPSALLHAFMHSPKEYAIARFAYRRVVNAEKRGVVPLAEIWHELRLDETDRPTRLRTMTRRVINAMRISLGWQKHLTIDDDNLYVLPGAPVPLPKPKKLLKQS